MQAKVVVSRPTTPTPFDRNRQAGRRPHYERRPRPAAAGLPARRQLRLAPQAPGRGHLCETSGVGGQHAKRSAALDAQQTRHVRLPDLRASAHRTAGWPSKSRSRLATSQQQLGGRFGRPGAAPSSLVAATSQPMGATPRSSVRPARVQAPARRAQEERRSVRALSRRRLDRRPNRLPRSSREALRRMPGFLPRVALLPRRVTRRRQFSPRVNRRRLATRGGRGRQTRHRPHTQWRLMSCYAALVIGGRQASTRDGRP